MASYFAYGLSFASDFDLPGYPSGDASPDAVIRRGGVSPPQAALDSGRHSWHDLHAGYLFHPSFGAIRISNGTEILVESHLPDDAVAPWLTGPALAILLHQRGCVVLHGSAVSWNGKAVVLLGASGAGKSTMAHACSVHGFGVLSDDHAVVTWRDDLPVVLPGGAQIRLRPDSLLAAGLDPAQFPRLWHQEDKRGLNCAGPVIAAPTRLSSVYELWDGESLGISPLDPQSQFRLLMRHSFLAPLLKMSGTEALHFERCTRLASAIPPARFIRPRDLSLLGRAAEFLKESMAGTHG